MSATCAFCHKRHRKGVNCRVKDAEIVAARDKVAEVALAWARASEFWRAGPTGWTKHLEVACAALARLEGPK